MSDLVIERLKIQSLNHPIAQSPNFLQDRDLPRMIKLMLRHPVKHMVEIVLLSGNPLPKPGLWQRRNRRYERPVRLLRLRHALAPRGSGRSLWNKREIRQTFGLPFLTGHPAARGRIPDRNV